MFWLNLLPSTSYPNKRDKEKILIKSLLLHLFSYNFDQIKISKPAMYKIDRTMHLVCITSEAKDHTP